MLSAFDVTNKFYIISIILFVYSTKKNSFHISLLKFFTSFLFGLILKTFNIQNKYYSYPYSYFYIGKVPVSVIITWYTIFIHGKSDPINTLFLFFNRPKEKKQTISSPL